MDAGNLQPPTAKLATVPAADSALIQRCLCLDIGTTQGDALALRDIGLYRPDTGQSLRLAGNARDFVSRLDALTHGAQFVLGHNITQFDLPALMHLYPDLALHRLPVVDTLTLSPIAFAENPYHHLLKDYRLCSTSRSDSVRDAELAHALLQDIAKALTQRSAEHPEEAACLHFLLVSQGALDHGLDALLSQWRGGSARPDLHTASLAWLRATRGKACTGAQRRVMHEWLQAPDWHLPLAYVLAWLRVAGGNSVLPPWVGQRHPRAREIIRLLRDAPCTDAQCSWCREQHALEQLLPRYFAGVTQFRAKPTTADGRSLQQTVTENGMARAPTLAVLPTGGGKSLCYQLPALAGYYRTGSLTVVISPLQSLMLDQVQALQARGITCAGYLNGLLTPLERRAMLDRLRLGDLGLIYVAPEQFRSTAFVNALAYREVRAWVFDEAHCLSKWGHDFRPDYLYVSRFIKKRQPDGAAPVFCFTATAQPGVVADICKHFRQRLEQTLEPLIGGVERENLQYEVHAVPTQAKYGEALRLLQHTLQASNSGGAIVFCARQKTVEELAQFLNDAGLACGHFHGGMLPEDKRRTQDDFIEGRLRVIAATNAFGMGVDKPDVRLVIHLDTPGSLENYLQEAGRAGRDQGLARCVLLYDEEDLDVQFRLLRSARLTQHDIRSILKALRGLHKRGRPAKDDHDVIVSSGEILLELPDSSRIDPEARDADTKVRIAIAWLEEARLLSRHENHTRVFASSLLSPSFEDACKHLRQKLPEQADAEPYLTILAALWQTEKDGSLSTDELMLITGRSTREVTQMLDELRTWGLLADDEEIGVSFYSEPSPARRLQNLVSLETALLAQLREDAPDADDGQWQPLNVRYLCDRLRRSCDPDLKPERLARLLKALAEPIDEEERHCGCLALRPGGADHWQVRVLRSWRAIETICERRLMMAGSVLAAFSQLRKDRTSLVTCSKSELLALLQADVTLQQAAIHNWDLALRSALLHLNTCEVLHLARGKAVFRSAMRIELDPQASRRWFNQGDYKALEAHYSSKITQVHVMAEFAKLALVKMQSALQFVVDYFRLNRNAFIRRYFAGRKEVLELATTEAAHRSILLDLGNPEQQAIVAAPLTGSQLVLAGPGAGKTRVIVHRVAWLLRQCGVAPEAIMVLAYNRSAAHEIRRRLWQLVGVDAAGVTVQTLHRLALHLTGTSYAVALECNESIDFNHVLIQATQLLNDAARHTQDETPGVRAQDSDGTTDGAQATDEDATPLARDRLLAGLRFVLVDEYQDVSGAHYGLISALAGRTLKSGDDGLSLMAVGDDDQNIYAFSGANVRYIRQFETDYQARRYSLLENYRSSQHIVDAASSVITLARERMKMGEVLRVDHARRELPAGGTWAQHDPLTQGRVHALQVSRGPLAEASAALGELQRLYALESQRVQSPTDGATGAGRWGHFAVIARNWKDLEPLAVLCRQAGIPAQILREALTIPLYSTREGDALLQLLRGQQRTSARRRVTLRSLTLSRWLRRRHGLRLQDWTEHPYLAALAQFIAEVESTACGFDLVISQVIEAMYEFGSAGASHGGAPRPNAPLVLLTAHSAKGLEFDHVLVLDSGGWRRRSDEERRLFYVAMTRARLSLTLCLQDDSGHAFAANMQELALWTRPRTAPVLGPITATRVLAVSPEQVYLSWPGIFSPKHSVHRALDALQIGDPLTLRRWHGRDRSGNSASGWELLDALGRAVGRMARSFQLPGRQIVAVRVAAVQVRHAKPQDKGVKCQRWELVLPEIDYLD